MGVERCECHQVSFAELLRLSREEGLDLEGLMERTGCCTGCTMCEPYVRLTLRTGETSHRVLSGPEVAEIMRA